MTKVLHLALNSFQDLFTVDTTGGHGTHVCGSIAGSSLSEFSPMNGMAPDAKISFFDLGMTDRFRTNRNII